MGTAFIPEFGDSYERGAIDSSYSRDGWFAVRFVKNFKIEVPSWKPTPFTGWTVSQYRHILASAPAARDQRGNIRCDHPQDTRRRPGKHPGEDPSVVVTCHRAISAIHLFRDGPQRTNRKSLGPIHSRRECTDAAASRGPGKLSMDGRGCRKARPSAPRRDRGGACDKGYSGEGSARTYP
jgi:hypothetical protein